MRSLGTCYEGRCPHTRANAVLPGVLSRLETWSVSTLASVSPEAIGHRLHCECLRYERLAYSVSARYGQRTTSREEHVCGAPEKSVPYPGSSVVVFLHAFYVP